MTPQGAKALYEQPVSDAQGIAAVGRNIDEYKQAVQPSRTDSSSDSSVPKSSPVDKVNSGKYGSKPGEKRPGADGMPSYKKGTKRVPKTGPAKLHKGEAVVPVKKVKKNPKAMNALFGK